MLYKVEFEEKSGSLVIIEFKDGESWILDDPTGIRSRRWIKISPFFIERGLVKSVLEIYMDGFRRGNPVTDCYPYATPTDDQGRPTTAVAIYGSYAIHYKVQDSLMGPDLVPD